MCITEDKLVESYGKATPRERFRLIYKNYSIFPQLVDCYETGLFNRILFEVEYNRRKKDDDDLGVRIQTSHRSEKCRNNAAQAAPAKAAAADLEEKVDFSNVKIEPIFEEMVDFDTFAKSDFRAVKILACEAVPKSKKLLKFTLDDGERKDRVILSGIHEYYEPEELVGKTAIAIVNLPPRKMMGIDSEGMLISAVHEEDGHEGLNLLMVNDRIPAGAKLY